MNNHKLMTSYKFVTRVLGSVFVGLAFLFLIPGNARAADFGVSPASISNYHMKPGGTYERVLTISRTETEYDLEVTVLTEMGEKYNSWISFEPGSEFTIEEGETTKELNVIIDVPSDAEIDDYSGCIRLTTTPVDSEGSAVAVSQGVRINIDLTLTEDDYLEFIVRLMSIDPFSRSNDLPLMLKVENMGNISGSPDRAVLEVQDLQRQDVGTLETTDIGNVSPGKTEEIYAYFEHELDVGKYFAQAEVYYEGESLRDELISFEVREGDLTSDDEETEKSSNTRLIVAILAVAGAAIAALAVGCILKKKNESKECRHKKKKNK